MQPPPPSPPPLHKLAKDLSALCVCECEKHTHTWKKTKKTTPPPNPTLTNSTQTAHTSWGVVLCSHFPRKLVQDDRSTVCNNSLAGAVAHQTWHQLVSLAFIPTLQGRSTVTGAGARELVAWERREVDSLSVREHCYWSKKTCGLREKRGRFIVSQGALLLEQENLWPEREER